MLTQGREPTWDPLPSLTKSGLLSDHSLVKSLDQDWEAKPSHCGQKEASGRACGSQRWMEWVLPVHKAAVQGQCLGMERGGDPSCSVLPWCSGFPSAHVKQCRASGRVLGTRISVLGKVFILE